MPCLYDAYSLVDDDDKPLADGERGEICCAAASMCIRAKWKKCSTPATPSRRFSILNSVVSVTTQMFPVPVTLSGEMFVNVSKNTPDSEGFAVGASVGKLSGNFGDWRVFYQYQAVEQESVFSAFAQDDFLLATNFKGQCDSISTPDSYAGPTENGMTRLAAPGTSARRDAPVARLDLVRHPAPATIVYRLASS
jgi:hypothetical protein